MHSFTVKTLIVLVYAKSRLKQQNQHYTKRLNCECHHALVEHS